MESEKCLELKCNKLGCIWFIIGRGNSIIDQPFELFQVSDGYITRVSMLISLSLDFFLPNQSNIYIC